MKTPPAGIIFDMDDTIAATGALWRRAESELLARLGHEWSAGLAAQYKGMNTWDVASTIHRLLQPEISAHECGIILRDRLTAAFEAGPILAMDGAVDCVRAAAKIAPLALASGSPLLLIELALDRLELKSAFTALISSESVSRGKPFPDVFLAAAESLAVQPAGCLVFEDSLVGVNAAIAAGMRCFAVPSSHRAEIEGLATRTFASLRNVRPEDIETASGTVN